MGGAVSAGEDNEELVDNLVDAEYLKTPFIEKCLRAVDRGNYYLEDQRDVAYKDLAWKHGKLHLSAPCIYSEVLECLEIKEGMSFLNLGSGTGYLSTVVGLLLGGNGMNLGVEVHQSVVDYAEKKLEEFIQKSLSFDLLDFTPPQFIVGNCLQLDPSSTYEAFDRVYCGATVPEHQKAFIKGLLTVNGIAVLPCGDQLMKCRRIGKNEFEWTNVLPVSFASLIEPTAKELASSTHVNLPLNEGKSLQELCRVIIRRKVREKCLMESPSADIHSILIANRNKKKLDGNKRKNNRIRTILIPLFHSTDSDPDENLENEDQEVEGRGSVGNRMIAVRTFGASRMATGRIRMENFESELLHPSLPQSSSIPATNQEGCESDAAETVLEDVELDGFMESTSTSEKEKEEMKGMISFEMNEASSEEPSQTTTTLEDAQQSSQNSPHSDKNSSQYSDAQKPTTVDSENLTAEKQENNVSDSDTDTDTTEEGHDAGAESTSTTSSSDEEENKTGESNPEKDRVVGRKPWRKCDTSGTTSDDEQERPRKMIRRELHEKYQIKQEEFSITFRCLEYMQRIFSLPVPQNLQEYLNFNRDW